MIFFKQRKWGKPKRNLNYMRISSLPYFWGDESYVLSDFFLPGDPPEEFNIAADSSGKSQQEFYRNWWGFAGTFLGFTSWRVFIANPQARIEESLESTPYSNLDINFQVRSEGLTMDIIERTKFIGERLGCKSFLITDKQRFQIESLLSGVQPEQQHLTTIEYFSMPWGHRVENPGQALIAELAKKNSGDSEIGMARCTRCGWENSENVFRSIAENSSCCPGCLRKFR